MFRGFFQLIRTILHTVVRLFSKISIPQWYCKFTVPSKQRFKIELCVNCCLLRSLRDKSLGQVPYSVYTRGQGLVPRTIYMKRGGKNNFKFFGKIKGNLADNCPY